MSLEATTIFLSLSVIKLVKLFTSKIISLCFLFFDKTQRIFRPIHWENEWRSLVKTLLARRRVKYVFAFLTLIASFKTSCFSDCLFFITDSETRRGCHWNSCFEYVRNYTLWWFLQWKQNVFVFLIAKFQIHSSKNQFCKLIQVLNFFKIKLIIIFVFEISFLLFDLSF